MAYIRTQVQLRPDQHKKLKQRAFKRGISLSHVIREMVDRDGGGPERTPEDIEVALSMVGLGSDPKADVAERHDDYLYGDDG